MCDTCHFIALGTLSVQNLTQKQAKACLTQKKPTSKTHLILISKQAKKLDTCAACGGCDKYKVFCRYAFFALQTYTS